MPKADTTRYQVFVSSTFVDLREERQATVRAILELEAIPVGTELFAAANDDPWDLIKGVIEASDYYVLIVGHRYGTVSPDGQSFTKKEYDYAVKAGKPVLAFLHQDATPLQKGNDEADRTNFAKLTAFKTQLVNERLVSFFGTPDDLHGKVRASLMQAFQASPQEGWKRGGSGSKTGAFQGGLVEFRKDSDGISYESLIKESGELLIVLNDGLNWIQTHQQALKERTNQGNTKTSFLLIHPDSDFLPVLLRKNGKTPKQQVDDLRRSIEIIESLRSGRGAVEVRGHFLFNSYAMILGDQRAIVLPYFLTEVGAPPVCVFEKDLAGESLYWRYQRDARTLYNESTPLTAHDSDRTTRTPSPAPDRSKQQDRRRDRNGSESRNPIFISYSHRDRKWLEELLVSLKPIIRDGAIKVWDDTQIATGARWREEIRLSLESAQAAVLLVSRYFFASDFIARNELQPLLEAANDKGVKILWIAVSASSYERSKIGIYQCVNDPAKPLDTLSKAQRGGVFVQIAEKIRQAAGDS